MPVELPQDENVTKTLDPCNVIYHEQSSPVSNQPRQTLAHSQELSIDFKYENSSTNLL